MGPGNASANTPARTHIERSAAALVVDDMIDADEIVRAVERALVDGSDSETVHVWRDGEVTREGIGHRDDWALHPDSRPIASFVVNGDVVARAPILEEVLRGFDERGIPIEEGS